MAPPGGDPFDLLHEDPFGSDPLLRGAQELVGLGDYEGALDLLQKLKQRLGDRPIPPAAKQLQEDCEGMLIRLCESRIGPLTQIPKLVDPSGDLVWLNLDHRAGFLLSPGGRPGLLRGVFALSGMPRLETIRILAQLMREAVIGI